MTGAVQEDQTMTQTIMTQIVTRDGFSDDRFSDVEPVALADYAGNGALLLAVDDDVSEVSAHFGTLELIVIPFASSADGRGFSLAASLRAMGFGGHIRASGHVLVDQFRAALRSGFTDIAISAEQARRNPEAQWQAVSHDAGYKSKVLSA